MRAHPGVSEEQRAALVRGRDRDRRPYYAALRGAAEGGRGSRPGRWRWAGWGGGAGRHGARLAGRLPRRRAGGPGARERGQGFPPPARRRLEVWHVYLMAFCIGSASSFDWPARLSLVPNLVPREHLQSAVALNAASFNVSRIIGPALGGVLLVPLGVTGCFFLAAACYLPFIVTLATVLQRVDLAPPSGREHRPFATLRAGYSYIWSHKTLRALLSIDLIPVMLGMTYFGLLPVLAGEVLHRGSGGLGALQACAGAGALIGVLIVAALSGIRGRGRIVLSGLMGFGAMLLCLGLSSNFLLSCAILVGMTLLADLYGSLNDTLVQTVTDDEYRGRVMAVYSMIWGLTPIGNLEGGTLAHFFGVQAALATNGVLIMLFGLLLWRLLDNVRKLE
ncbi:MAG: MFS transporter [Thermomicrobiales bacterium]